MRFLFFIYSIVMNITCLFRTWPYSCIWLRTGSTRKFVWEFEENKSRVLDAEWEGSILELAGARQTCAQWGPLELGAKWIRHIEDCVSPPYVKTFNSKLIKRFCTWTRSSYVFLRRNISTISTNQKYLALSLAHDVFMLGQYIHSEKFAYATLATFPHSRLHFILNWGVRADILLFSLEATTHFAYQAYMFLLCQMG